MKNTNIVDRVVDRIQKQPLGDLITEEDLYDIVKEALPKAFFEPQRVTTSEYGQPKVVTKDPVIVEALRAAITPVVEKQVNEFLANHADEVMAFWIKATDEGIERYVNKIVAERSTLQIRHMLSGLVDELNRERGRMGLPWINMPL